ncbi:MAG TPA: ATP-binding cassette domain-containing protein [Coriobacteriia bacterium]
MIVFDDVSFAYPGAGAGRPALSGASLSVAPGRIVAVVGANGSGKSTLARLCDGLLLPTRGVVTVDGDDTRDETALWEIRSRVGMVLQDPDDQIVGTVVEEDVAFGPENLGVPPAELRERVTSALAEVGLPGFERREPHLLSEGQKQRVAIAGALAMRPAYLVLDEPTALLDPAGRLAVLDLIDRLARDAGHGIVHVSHDVGGVARADSALVLKAGEVVYDGPPAGLLGDGPLLASAGLALSAIGRLGAALRAAGLDVPPTALDAEAVAGALWR